MLLSPNNLRPRHRRNAEPAAFGGFLRCGVSLSRPRVNRAMPGEFRAPPSLQHPQARRNKRDVQDRDGGIIARSSRADIGTQAPGLRIGCGPSRSYARSRRHRT
jgi:hypothetical protein